jgi:3-phenylpropionate/trans-cinnamate dioxygenase ferredoxin subunit
MTSHRVADERELSAGQLMAVEVGGRPVCLARVADGTVYAVSDICTHEQVSLSEGEIWERSVQCPQHGSLFDLATGEVTGLPAQVPLETFPVRVDGGSIFVDVE